MMPGVIPRRRKSKTNTFINFCNGKDSKPDENLRNRAFLGLIIFSSLASADQNQSRNINKNDEQVRALQNIGPVQTYNPNLSGDVRVKASITRKLEPAERVDIPYVQALGQW